MRFLANLSEVSLVSFPVDEDGLVAFLESMAIRFQNLSNPCQLLKDAVRGKSYDEIMAIVSIQPAEIKEPLLDYIEDMKLR